MSMRNKNYVLEHGLIFFFFKNDLTTNQLICFLPNYFCEAINSEKKVRAVVFTRVSLSTVSHTGLLHKLSSVEFIYYKVLCSFIIYLEGSDGFPVNKRLLDNVR